MACQEANTVGCASAELKPNPSRLSIVDYLKAFAIFLVVFTHGPWSEEDRQYLFFGFVVDMAVPIFMVLSGYTLSLSDAKRVKAGIRYYSWLNLGRKLSRFLIPFVVIYLAELAVLHVKGELPNSLFLFFLQGGGGRGSYYVPCLVQLVLIFPLIAWLSRNGVVALFGANLAYELLVAYFGLDPSVYRLLVFRYLFLLAIGVFLFKNDAIKGRPLRSALLGVSLLIGVIYVVSVRRFENDLVLFRLWPSTSMMVGFYLLPIFDYVFRKGRDFKLGGRSGAFLSICGRASYHIYLFQMLWFMVSGFIYWKMSLPYGKAAQVVVNLIGCVGGGCLFWALDERISRKRLPRSP